MAFSDLDEIGEMFSSLSGHERHELEIVTFASWHQRLAYKRRWNAELRADPVRYPVVKAYWRERGRTQRAAHPGFTKHRLSADQARLVREQYAAGLQPSRICKDFGITKTAMRLIVIGQSHPRAGGPVRREPSRRRAKGLQHANAKLTPLMVGQIRSSSLSNRKLAAELGVNHATVWSVRAGKTWASE